MKKLARYLKPFTFMLILAVFLLFGQAMCDLNLPNYMSNIVNVGIQQNGIENASPEAISANGMKFEQTFMTDEQIDYVDSHYQLVETGGNGQKYEEYLKKYPLLADEDIYVLKDADKEIRKTLDQAFGESAWTFINTIKTVSAQLPQSAVPFEGSGSDDVDVASMDFSKLYALQPLFNLIPDSVIEEARTEALKNERQLNARPDRSGHSRKLLQGAGNGRLKDTEQVHNQDRNVDVVDSARRRNSNHTG